jgi:hypothetical protein
MSMRLSDLIPSDLFRFMSDATGQLCEYIGVVDGGVLDGVHRYRAVGGDEILEPENRAVELDMRECGVD